MKTPKASVETVSQNVNVFSAEQEQMLRNIDSLITEADEHSVAAEDAKLAVGKLLVRLVDNEDRDQRKTISEIAEWFKGKPGRSRPNLSRYYNTAKAWSDDARAELPKGTPYETLSMLRQGCNAIQRNIQKQLKRNDIQVRPAEVLKKWPQLLFVGKGKSKTGRRGSRDITKTLNQLVQAEYLPERQKLASEAIKGTPENILNRCHHKDFIDVLDRMPDGSIRLLHLDPPYGQYGKTKSGRRKGQHDMSVSAAQFTECDNNDAENSVRVVVEALQRARRVLRPNGVIVLWQAGTYLRKEILEICEAENLTIAPPLIWNKKRPQAADNSSAVSLSVEFAWIIFRAEDAIDGLEHVNGLETNCREQIKDFQPVHMDAAEIAEPKHTFEKPAAWNEFLLDKLTVPGDCVFDAFGCMGTMAVACIQKDRVWVHCESNAVNYQAGAKRIETALQKRAAELPAVAA